MSQKNIKTENIEQQEIKHESDLSKYEFKNTIGQGNFGKVKLAIYLPTNEKVAIKILNKETIDNKNEMHLVKRELNIIKTFTHINVIKVSSIIEDELNYYIIMEYCQHGELFDYIVNHKRLTDDESSIFFHQLINGIEYIHSQKIVHRDLKPENLLLNKDKILKIIDFGLSSSFDGRNLLTTKCGSPSYAAPEIIRGNKYDGFKTDIWCCGIILYAMLCGYLPFEGDDNNELFNNILQCQIEYPPFISDEAREVIDRTLTTDPDKRISLEEIKNTSFYLKGKELCGEEYYEEMMKINKEDAIGRKMKKKVRGLRIVNSNSDINTFRQRIQSINQGYHKRGETFASKINEILQTDNFKNKNNLNKLVSLISPKNKNMFTNNGIFSNNNHTSNMNRVIYRFKPKFSLRQLIEIKNNKCEIPVTNNSSQNTTTHLHQNSSNIAITNNINLSGNEIKHKRNATQTKITFNPIDHKMNIGKGTKTTREQQTKRNYTMLTTEPKEKKKSKSQNKINKNEMRKNRTTTNNNISSKKRNKKGVNTESGNIIFASHSSHSNGKYIVQTATGRREKSAYKPHAYQTSSVLPKLKF